MEDAEEREFQRLWGPWASLVPADAAGLFEGYPSRWWITGGWAIGKPGCANSSSGATPAIPGTRCCVGPRATLTGALEFGTQEKSVRAG
jgi:hypothetical protein